MYQSDYAAAFVTVRSYGILGVHPTVESYRSILHPLSLRIQTEIQQATEKHPIETTWAYRFLSVPKMPTEVDFSTLKRIVGFGERTPVRFVRSRQARLVSRI